MKVKELFDHARSRIIAFTMDGKLLFDSERNPRDFMVKFFDDDICVIWADFNKIMIYVTRRNWEVQDDA